MPLSHSKQNSTFMFEMGRPWLVNIEAGVLSAGMPTVSAPVSCWCCAGTIQSLGTTFLFVQDSGAIHLCCGAQQMVFSFRQ